MALTTEEHRGPSRLPSPAHGRRLRMNCLEDGRTVLYYLGLWRDSNQPQGKAATLLSWIPKVILAAAYYNALIGFPVMAYKSFGVDVSLTFESISGNIVTVLVISCLHCLIYKHDRMVRVFEAMKAMRVYGSKLPERPFAALERIERLSKLLGGAMWLCLVALNLTFLTIPSMYAGRKYPNVLWYPFEETASPVYGPLLAFSCLAHEVTISCVMTVIIMFVALMLAAVAEFRVLTHNLRLLGRKTAGRLVEQSGHPMGKSLAVLHGTLNDRALRNKEVRRALMDEEETAELLKKCVKHHNSIVRFVDEVRAAYSPMMFMFTVCVLVPNGFALAQLVFTDEVNVKTMTHILLLVAGNSASALIFWFAEAVTTESLEVREAVYDCDWFDQSESFKRSMRIIMSRSNQPVVVKVAGFVPLSMETYYSITQMCYTFCMAAWAFISKQPQVAG